MSKRARECLDGAAATLVNEDTAVHGTAVSGTLDPSLKRARLEVIPSDVPGESSGPGDNLTDTWDAVACVKAIVVSPPLQSPRSVVIPISAMDLMRRKPTAGATMHPKILPLSAILALPTRHALPTRALDTEFADVVDAAGALVPPPPAKPITLSYFRHVDTTCLQEGADAENSFRVAAEAAAWRMRNIVRKDGGSAYEASNVRQHVDLLLRGTPAAVRALSGVPYMPAADARGVSVEEVKHVVKPAVEPEVELWVDVKAVRSLRRRGAKSNATVALELHAKGCLQKGRADVFAYEVFNTHLPECSTPELMADAHAVRPNVERAFILLDRVKLLDWVCGALDFGAPPVAFSEQSLNRMYCRDDYGSILTNVRLEEAYAAAGCGIVCVGVGE